MTGKREKVLMIFNTNVVTRGGSDRGRGGEGGVGICLTCGTPKPLKAVFEAIFVLHK